MYKLKVLLIGSLLLLNACAHQAVNHQASAEQAPVISLKQGLFVDNRTSLQGFNQLLISDLKLENIKTAVMPGVKQAEYLSEQDKKFYKEHYTRAIVEQLIIQRGFSTTVNPSVGTLLMEAALLQEGIRPEGKSAADDRYQSEQNHLTFVLELKDAVSGELVLALVRTTDLGVLREKDHHFVNDTKVRAAFDAWLAELAAALDLLTAR